MYISTAKKRVTQVSYLRLGGYKGLGQNNYYSPHMGFGIAVIEGLDEHIIPLSQFDQLFSLDDVMERLFGSLPTPAAK